MDSIHRVRLFEKVRLRRGLALATNTIRRVRLSAHHRWEQPKRQFRTAGSGSCKKLAIKGSCWSDGFDPLRSAKACSPFCLNPTDSI
ncbi:hypothetical protein RP20_CCG012649 [Aedes albopictus]|nr:hypothetical protein RP20_CCG012649 [Aedes albopictus]